MAIPAAGIDTIDPDHNVPPAGFDPSGGGTLLGHPTGLFLLFFVEMWERFSYYGMRALLVLYLIKPTKPEPDTGFFTDTIINPGREWSEAQANTLYGWYTGLAYLLPIVGGIIADKLLGTHRSMLLGGIVIAIGHIMLAISGIGEMDKNALGMSVFIAGLATIIIGTGYFKPTVSTMVGQLYKPGDPRRDGGFSIFYMGINLGAFLCAFVCGTLGQQVGWHWGFGSAAVGMVLGLIMYLIGKPYLLKDIGDPPKGKPNAVLPLIIGTMIVSGLVGVCYHMGLFGKMQEGISSLAQQTVLAWSIVTVLILLVIGSVSWFVAIQRPGDKGPTFSIFLFMLFNAFFWLAFEQAGSTMNVFADRSTDRAVTMPGWIVHLCTSPSWGYAWIVLGLLGAWMALPFVRWVVRAFSGSWSDEPRLLRHLLLFVGGTALVVLAVLRGFDKLTWLADFKEVPSSWFQSVNALFIIILAPVFGWLWIVLGRRNMNPTQPMKISWGLICVGLGFIFMVFGAMGNKDGALVSPWWLLGAYFVHTVGELCLSPTGLSYVTKAAPVRFVSLLMGIWFVSSFIANLGGGLIAAQVEAVERGEIEMPWSFGGRADFFMLFVVSSLCMGFLVMVFTPLLKKLLRTTND